MLLIAPLLVFLTGSVLEVFVVEGRNVGGAAVLVAAILCVLIVYCDGFIRWRRKLSGPPSPVLTESRRTR